MLWPSHLSPWRHTAGVATQTAQASNRCCSECAVSGAERDCCLQACAQHSPQAATAGPKTFLAQATPRCSGCCTQQQQHDGVCAVSVKQAAVETPFVLWSGGNVCTSKTAKRKNEWIRGIGLNTSAGSTWAAVNVHTCGVDNGLSAVLVSSVVPPCCHHPLHTTTRTAPVPTRQSQRIKEG